MNVDEFVIMNLQITHTHTKELNWIDYLLSRCFCTCGPRGAKWKVRNFCSSFSLIFVFDFVNLWPSPPSPPVKDFWFSYHKWRIVKRRRCSSISSPSDWFFLHFVMSVVYLRKKKQEKNTIQLLLSCSFLSIPPNCYNKYQIMCKSIHLVNVGGSGRIVCTICSNSSISSSVNRSCSVDWTIFSKKFKENE